MHLEPLTSRSAAPDLDAWFGILTAAHRVDDPHGPPPWRAERIAGLDHPWPGARAVHHLVRDAAGEPVAALMVSTMRPPNDETAGVAITVRPDLRRRGVGTALLDRAVAEVRAAGRTRVLGSVVTAPPGGSTRDESGAAFLAARGFRPIGTEVRRRIDLANAPDDTAMHAEALARAGDAYELLGFAEPVPEEHAPDLAVLSARLSSDIAGYLEDWRPSTYDTDRIRAYEAVAAARGIRRLHVAARHKASGRLVAWSFVAVTAEDGAYGEQGVTVVLPEHRGRRLGMLVKTALHRRLAETAPELRFIDTWNADENGHMIGINERLGFVPVEYAVDHRRDL